MLGPRLRGRRSGGLGDNVPWRARETTTAPRIADALAIGFLLNAADYSRTSARRTTAWRRTLSAIDVPPRLEGVPLVLHAAGRLAGIAGLEAGCPLRDNGLRHEPIEVGAQGSAPIPREAGAHQPAIAACHARSRSPVPRAAAASQ